MISILLILRYKVFKLNLDHLNYLYHFAHVFFEVGMHDFKWLHGLCKVNFKFLNLWNTDEIYSLSLNVPPNHWMHRNVLQHLLELSQLLPQVRGDQRWVYEHADVTQVLQTLVNNLVLTCHQSHVLRQHSFISDQVPFGSYFLEHFLDFPPLARFLLQFFYELALRFQINLLQIL